jgi:aspartate ammonia-lyase
MTVYYGDETKKALTLLGKSRTPRTLIRAYGEVKLAAVRAQQQTAHLYPDNYFPLLEQSAEAIIAGTCDDSFPLPLEQGGAGTSLHMNICEVLANMTNEKYAAVCPGSTFRAHPLDHIARFQSTNDTFPTAVIVMTYRFLESVETGIVSLQEQLVSREGLYEQWLMTGRTELQDALPMTLGQVFGSWAGPVERDRWRINKLKERIRTVPLGGTAIGTGFSAPRDYIFAAERELRRITKLPLCRSQNLCDQVAHTDSLAECAQGMALCADNLYKMVSDLLLYTSSLSGEIHHRELQYGSTIMPAKVNPVVLELIRGLVMECSSAARLVCDYSRSGQWQLNANLPFLAAQMILMMVLEPDRSRMEAQLAHSPALLNVFRDVLSYTEIKKLLPELKQDKPDTLKSLADWLVSHTGLDRTLIDQRLELRSLTGFLQEKDT